MADRYRSAGPNSAVFHGEGGAALLVTLTVPPPDSLMLVTELPAAASRRVMGPLVLLAALKLPTALAAVPRAVPVADEVVEPAAGDDGN